MQVTETLAEGLKRQFKVLVPAGEIDQKVEHRLREISKTLKLPGFRPGKVPMPLLKQRYGTSVLGEVLEQAVQDSSSQAMMERGIRPALQPKIEVTAFAEGTDLEYTMALELLPEVAPIDFGSLQFERLKADVTDAEIDKGIERLKAQQKRTEPVAEARPAKTGDTVVIDFVGKLDGVPFEGGSAEGHQLELGSGSFIPGFEDQLVGVSPGETREITVTFPESYGAENLAGKPATFTVTAKELRQPAAVEVDEAFAKSFGMDSLDALRTAIREQLERDYAQASRLQLKRKLLDKLADMHSFEVPAGMVDAEFDAIWKQVEEARKQNRLDPETAAKSEDDLRTEYRGIAERRVRLGLLLSEVGRLNNISVKDDELKRAVIDEARKYPGQERQVIELYRKNPDAMGSLRAPIFEEKTVDFILEMAKLTDRTVPVSELFEEPEAATA